MPVDQIEKTNKHVYSLINHMSLFVNGNIFLTIYVFILTITFNSLKANTYKCIYKFTSQNEEKIYLRIHQYVQLVLLIFNCWYIMGLGVLNIQASRASLRLINCNY